ncbi:hypothetical protein OG897_40740 [Streptomyces sp. NBC_00237]|nr:hypothetical protein [Streptomyces sp. NBC_00237]MCX5207713.1 hypothetical protein [Streptomyces sp. NBC_00237]
MGTVRVRLRALARSCAHLLALVEEREARNTLRPGCAKSPGHR